MKKNVLLLLSLVAFGGSVSAMENNNQNPGDAAITNNPKAWLATKIAGGFAGMYGGLLGFSAHLDSGFYKHEPLPLRLLEGTLSPYFTKSRLGRLTNLFMLAPIIYGSWKGGQAVSKAAWYPAWNGVDKIQRFKESIKK